MNSGYRQAALALHGLTKDDQKLLLTQLPEGDREALHALIRELDELGFPPVAANEGGALVRVPGRQDARHRVACATAAQIADVVAHESPVLIAQLLRMENWPWTDALLASLSVASGLAIHAALDHVEQAPARDRLLLDMVAKSIRPMAVDVDQKPRGFIQKVKAWIR